MTEEISLLNCDTLEDCPLIAFVNQLFGMWALPIFYRLVVIAGLIRFGDLQQVAIPIAKRIDQATADIGNAGASASSSASESFTSYGARSSLGCMGANRCLGKL